MGGRFYIGLAYLSLAGMVVSTVFALAVMIGRVELNPTYQLVAFLVPMAIVIIALFARSVHEVILSNAVMGLHPSNRRRALATCFAPYRARRFRRWFVTDFRKRIVAIWAFFAAVLILSGTIIPFAFSAAFLFSLRRAAWFGNTDAIVMEWDWLRLRGPISSPAGRNFASSFAATQA